MDKSRRTWILIITHKCLYISGYWQFQVKLEVKLYLSAKICKWIKVQVVFFQHLKQCVNTRMLTTQKTRPICLRTIMHYCISLVICCLLLNLNWFQERIFVQKNWKVNAWRTIAIFFLLMYILPELFFLQWALQAGLWPPVPSFLWSTETLESQRQKWALTQYDRWQKAVSSLCVFVFQYYTSGTFYAN